MTPVAAEPIQSLRIALSSARNRESKMEKIPSLNRIVAKLKKTISLIGQHE